MCRRIETASSTASRSWQVLEYPCSTILSLPVSSSPGSILANQKTRKHKPKEALKLVKPSFLLVREYEENIVDSRLLHHQHLVGIRIGQDQYRLPLPPK